MLLKFLYFFVVIHSISCAFPKYIEKCPKADPNANNCVLKKAREAFSVLIHGDKDLHLQSFTPLVLTNTKLQIENNSDIVISGALNPSNDSQVSQARIDMQQKYWYIVYSAKMITLNLDYTITVRETKNKAVTAKGRLLINLINSYYEYTGYYDTVTIKKQKYMQITSSKTRIGYEKYMQSILELKSTDNKKLNDSDRQEVLKELNSLELSLIQYVDAFFKEANTNTFNTILKLEPEEDIFFS